jgi:dihydropteroate synthase
MLLRQAEKMVSEGASILDFGGLSSRPGALEISEDAEIDRVIPAIRLVASRFPTCLISVDSYRYNVAKAALDAGASIINDIGAGEHESLALLAAVENTPYICMHMRVTPNHAEFDRLVKILSPRCLIFISRKAEYTRLGVNDLIIDPGLVCQNHGAEFSFAEKNENA